MEKNRKTKGIIITILILVVITLTVAFATLSKELTITGNAYLDPIKWGLKFQNISVSEVTDLVKEDIKTPTIDTSDPTKINGLEVTFTKPKQKVEYEVELVNESDVQVEIANINKTKLSYEYIEFNVRYKDENKELEIGDVISANSVYKLIITVYYNDANITKETLNANDINLNLSYSVTFKQSESNINVTTKDRSYPIVSGKLGDNVTFTYNKGEIKIDGTGDMDSSDRETLVEKIASKLLDTLEVSDNVKNYYQEQRILNYKITNGYRILDMDSASFDSYVIQTINDSSLSDKEKEEAIDLYNRAPSFKSLSMSEGVTSIKRLLFGLISVNNFTIPDSVVTVTQNGFSMCIIDTLTLGKGLTVLPKSFIVSANINNLVIPEGVTKIEDDAFDAVGYLKTLTIPSTVTEIGNGSLDFKSLTTIVNKTGKAFDFKLALTGNSGETIETGTVEVNGRTITITK